MAKFIAFAALSLSESVVVAEAYTGPIFDFATMLPRLTVVVATTYLPELLATPRLPTFRPLVAETR
jgi:hypothetical protein